MTAENLSFVEVVFLTFQAVVEVVIVCLMGFWAAYSGLLDKSAQKKVSALNVDLFTPAMIFSKLAPSLSLQKLLEVFVIPVFFAVSTGISYLVSRFVSAYLNLDEAEGNFVTAMSVFGNSNSLPVSLTLALSYTLPNLEWDDIENDTPEQVASRGILYLLIFQQIGQVLRWSWGYNTLLKRPQRELLSYTEENIETTDPVTKANSHSMLNGQEDDQGDGNGNGNSSQKSTSATTSLGSSHHHPLLATEDSMGLTVLEEFDETILGRAKSVSKRFLGAMNPPLWAMLASLVVASTHPLQHELFVKNGFLKNTITKAIEELGGVCIPLILIVLGSNLYPSSETPPATPKYTRIVAGSLISRMIIPPLILLPMIALCVKIFPVSILDDPIFLVVAFILTISPPAIQLSQICQLNELYEKEMAGVLFWGYVVLTLPATIGIVGAALSVLKWADNP